MGKHDKKMSIERKKARQAKFILIIDIVYKITSIIKFIRCTQNNNNIKTNIM